MTKATSLVFVLYDGIEHSVFEGQVLAPLLKKLSKNILLTITIVSFEKKYPSEDALKRLKKQHPRLCIKLFKKTFFFGWVSIIFGALQLYPHLQLLRKYTIIARGPLAGLIVQRSITKGCTSFTLQARGLLAEEHKFSYKKSLFLPRWLHSLRTQQLAYWEKESYTYSEHKQFFIQVVSSALKEYLINKYSLNETVFSSQASEDIPTTIEPALRSTFRLTLRKKLKIPENNFVYVYNGSAKPWQCPEETVLFFKDQLKRNKNTFLLLITTDIKVFKKICSKEGLPSTTYRIITLSHKDVISYLCIADQGILLREKNIINWVSRPTKFLEYKAVGLPVVHNQTVAFIE